MVGTTVGTTLQRNITIYVLVLGVAGGLLLILAILFLCKYCSRLRSQSNSSSGRNTASSIIRYITSFCSFRSSHFLFLAGSFQRWLSLLCTRLLPVCRGCASERKASPKRVHRRMKFSRRPPIYPSPLGVSNYKYGHELRARYTAEFMYYCVSNSPIVA